MLPFRLEAKAFSNRFSRFAEDFFAEDFFVEDFFTEDA